MGTYGSFGLEGAAACPSLGACSRVWSFIATSRNSVRMGGNCSLLSVVAVVVEESASVELKSADSML